MVSSDSQEMLHIRLLGEPEVVAGGRSLPLPPSKKTRALLGYLVLSQRPHRRERLCDLLWDVADDRRAALRWSLTKLRELLDAPGMTRLCADRERVSIDLSSVSVDVFELKRLLGDSPERATTAALEAARALFRGELLEGLELPDFHGYYAWCVAERKIWRDRHRQLLSTLLARMSGHPDKALPLVRELVELDPLDEGARAQLLELLHATGKIREAEEQSRASRRLLASVPAALAPYASTPTPPATPAEALVRRSLAPEEVPFVGRRSERERIQAWLESAPNALRIVLIQGDAGAGKSRLLRELTREAASAGARVVTANVPEVRAGWPYAPWLEILNALVSDDTEASVRERLGPLLANASAPTDVQVGREQLFRATAECIERCVPDSGRLVIALDDLHWLDDASAELLHYVARAVSVRLRADEARVDILLTVRAGELQDQPNVARVVRALRRERLLEPVELCALTREQTFELIAALAEPALQESVYEQSAGNPLFALELARAAKSAESLPRSIAQLVRDRLDGLAPELADLLRWAAVLGSRFEPEQLAALASCSPEALVEMLEQLERYGWLVLAATGLEACAFSHEIVRRAVYDQLSDPRRRLMHARVAKLLSAQSPDAHTPAAALAHHAALGGNLAMAAHACLAAARRSLSLFALADAAALARRGLAYAEDLADPERTSLSLELFDIAVRAHRPEAPAEILPQLVALTTRALDLGDVAHARLGFQLRSALMWETGQHADAEKASRDAERISRLGARRDRIVGLSEAARCLTSLQRDLPEAEALLLEAEALAAVEGCCPPVMALARGMLTLHRGELESAASELERAREIARRAGERFEEFYALEYRIDVELARARYDAARTLCEELVSLGERLHHGSEAPLAHALLALSRYACGSDEDQAAFEAPLGALAAADAKQRLGLVLVRAAQLERRRERWSRCASYAARAYELAEFMERASDAALALALLVEAAAAEARGPQDAQLNALQAKLELPLSAEARAAACNALSAWKRERTGKEKRDGVRHGRARVR